MRSRAARRPAGVLGTGGQQRPAEPTVVIVEQAVHAISMACDMATDCGCLHAYLAALVDTIDQHAATIASGRDELASIIGWPSIKETAGSDAGGKEPQRSGTLKDGAGASRQTSRRRS